MEPFIVSALKYRPQQFKDVVGQSAITETLRNAILKNQLPQALLFCGPRGVGKTTCARILAKQINSKDHENIDPDQDFAFNIFELDAASNNSVDDIRSLNDQVRIPPQTGTHKVYIIDEVHMLSTAAFNAFLKTLEEPPKHVIFILATTEKHKIIPTILSRCQIFEFKRITASDTQNYLADLAKEQGITYEDEALHLIAQKADGAMRDALSIFDRMSSFCNQNLTAEAVAENLNILDKGAYLEFTDHLIANNIPDSLIQFDTILQKGIEGHQFVAGLAAHFRDLLVSKNPKTIPLLEISESLQQAYADQATKLSLSYLMDAIDLAHGCELNFKNSNNKRLHVELCIMQLASLHFDGEKKKQLIPTHKLNPSKTNTVASIPKTEEPKTVSEPVAEVVPTEPPKEVIPKPEIKIGSLQSNQVSSMSLSSIKKKKDWEQQQKPTEAIKDLPTEAFSEEELLNFWNTYQAMKFEKGDQNIASLLKISKPVLADSTTVHFNVPSDLNKVELEREFTTFVPYLRASLKNYDLSVKVIVDELTEKNFIYTPDEKYERLKEINPVIDLLKQEFDLDV
tara:strand:+ start:168 stop:1874 length:1707 start_codon:yes stop_codon:yes gene_type:complete